MSTSDKLSYLNTTKGLIKDSIEKMGVEVGNDTFRSYPDKITSQLEYYLSNGLDVLWNNWEKVIGTGTTLSLQNTLKGYMLLDLKGNTSQEGTPTPTSPQDIHVVSGNNTLKVEGKNLFSIKNWLDYFNISYTEDSDGAITFNTTSVLYNNTYPITPTDRITMSYKVKNGTGTNARFRFIYEDGSYNETTGSGTGTSEQTITNSSTSATVQGKVIGIRLNYSNSGTFTFKEVMVEKYTNGTASTYEPYKGNTYPITLGSIELCKIGDYQDKIYKENGKWYLHKEINKVVLDGSESWGYNQTNQVFYVSNLVEYIRTGFVPYSNYYEGKDIGSYSGLNNNQIGFFRSETTNRVVIKNTNYSETTDFKTWLSTHNTIVYYVLATPTNTEITDTNLTNELNNIYSETGTTNITQENDDLPIELDVVALKKEMIV